MLLTRELHSQQSQSKAMAAKAMKKGNSESLITYKVVKAHDGLFKGEFIQRTALQAEYCVSLGLWKKVEQETE